MNKHPELILNFGLKERGAGGVLKEGVSQLFKRGACLTLWRKG